MSFDIRFSAHQLRAIILALLVSPLFVVAPALGADLGDDCCVDLEDRIAELEQTVVRSGNRKIELEIYGTVSQAVLFWDDKHESNAYVVNNDNGTTSVTFDGEVELEDELEGWSFGVVFEIDGYTAGSGSVSQNNDDGIGDIDPTSTDVQLSDSSWWVAHERLGRLSVGFTRNNGASDGANENDLSGTDAASFVDVRDVGGGFALRRKNGDLVALNWEDIIDPLDVPDGNVVAYDTPVFAGFSASALWGEDDVWNVAIGFAKKQKGLGEIASGIAYGENMEGEDDGHVDYRQVTGSLALFHEPTGMHFLVAAGRREFTQVAQLNDGSFAEPEDAWYYYFKSGLVMHLNSLGATRYYSEFGRFRNFQTNAIDTDAVASIAGINAGTVCAGRRVACTSDESDAWIWGVGLVQDLDAAEAKLFIGYRHHEADIDLVDVSGRSVSGGDLESFDTVISGFILEF